MRTEEKRHVSNTSLLKAQMTSTARQLQRWYVKFLHSTISADLPELNIEGAIDADDKLNLHPSKPLARVFAFALRLNGELGLRVDDAEQCLFGERAMLDLNLFGLFILVVLF